MVCLAEHITYHFKNFKSYPQISLGPFFNIMTHLAFSENIYDGAFSWNSWQLKAVNYFHIKATSLMLNRVLMVNEKLIKVK